MAGRSEVTVVKKVKFRVPRISWDGIAEAVRRELRRKRLEPLQLVFVSAREIQKINRRYRRKDGPTNVLSFPETRDILIAPAVAEKEAREFKLSSRSWMVKLFIHAILHLEGYTHEKARDAKKMEKLEDQIMKDLNA